MRQSDKRQDHIVDDSGHNFDEAVINILNDIAHDPTTTERPTKTSQREEWKSDEADERLDSFFDLPDDL